ncbi:MAG: hypothetical protein GY889_08670 [Proteobacteria bacterium]|nr:hypothetical protein [Pseudomonadota bacterium]
MHWALLGIISLALIVVAGRRPKLAFGLLAILLAGVIVMLQLIPGEKERGSALISTGDVRLSQVHIEPGYGGSFDLSGRLENQAFSTRTVEVVLEVQLRDCRVTGQDTTEDCQILGTDTPRVGLAVPPGQARDFTVNLSFPRSRVRGRIDWQYRVTKVLGHAYPAVPAQ